MNESLIVPLGATVETAIRRICENTLGLVFVVDEAGRLVGVATDGDIRRGLLRGQGTDAPIADVMTRGGVALPVETPVQEALAKLSRKIRVIPLLDAEGRPVDYVTPYKHRRIPVASPNLEGNELEYVIDCIRSGWVSSKGAYITRFETDFAAWVGARHAICTSSGTTALHLALAAHDVGPGDEVIVPDLTFAATANVVLHAGATPVLVDVDRRTWNMSPEAAEAAITPKTKAIIPVHLYGQPADMDALGALADAHGLVLLEDAAEALGTKWGERRVGGLGRPACFSFFANKLITTGEGGMLVTDDDIVAARARKLRDHGMSPAKRYWHEEVGFNYRMTNLQAAVGVAQLERIDHFVGQKARMAASYRERLGQLDAIELPVELEGTFNSYWAFSVVLKHCGIAADRDEVMQRMLQRGVETRPVFYPMHRMPPYRPYSSGDYPASSEISDQGLTLPSSVDTSDTDIQHVCDTLEELFKSEELRDAVGA